MVVDNHVASVCLLNHHNNLSSSHRLCYRHKRPDYMFDEFLNGRVENVEEDRSLTNSKKFSMECNPSFLIQCMTVP